MLTFHSRKGIYTDILDPFQIEPDTFYLELAGGHIYANPHKNEKIRQAAEKTIARLGLDDGVNCDLRAKWFYYYADHKITEDYLHEQSPFVWYEAKRQGLL